jgi:hypothetical protein
MLTVCAHLLGCERNKVKKLEKNRVENIANIVWLTCTAVYLRDKTVRLRRTWEDPDSLHLDELTEINRELALESQREIRTETFELHQSRLKLHLCPMARLPTPVETKEVREALLTVNSCIKVRLDLQADKSPVVVKGPLFPRGVNPRYRIRGIMCNARIQSSKAR